MAYFHQLLFPHPLAGAKTTQNGTRMTTVLMDCVSSAPNLCILHLTSVGSYILGFGLLPNRVHQYHHNLKLYRNVL